MLTEILKQLWNKNLVLKALILLALPLLVVNALFPHLYGNNEIVLYILFLILFSGFDCYGFSLTQERDADFSELRIMYRVIQDMFEIVLMFWFYQQAGWKPVAASLIAHWFTTCDKLFYILRREPDYAGEYTWLEGWSIFLFTKYIGIKPTTTATFNIAAFVGFLAGTLICILF